MIAPGHPENQEETMKRIALIVLVSSVIAIGATAIAAQEIDDAKRNRNREQLAQLLDTVGPEVGISFSRHSQQPYTYVGHLRTGLTHAESFEVIIAVTNVDTYSLRAYPRYKGGYVNVDKAPNPASLMRHLLRLSDRTFLFWGIDADGDIFASYPFTLESGFPDASIRIVLRSIINHDRHFGELRLFID
jgi:hypothetical protein